MARPRSNSVKEVIRQMEPLDVAKEKPVSTSPRKQVPRVTSALTRWLVQPIESLKLVIVTFGTWAFIEYTGVLGRSNPVSHLIFISYPLVPASSEETPRFDKGLLDIAFVLFYIIVFSFLRQSITEYIIRPFSKSLGLKSDSKQTRFMEQAYAFTYFSASGSLGLWVMSYQKSWWYRTEHLWRMEGRLKCYYLLQLAYWCQQMLVLILRLEKPRSDFKELVIHHIVTLWLVGWSYFLNLTMIGTAIFVSMDIPDLSKCFNYLDLQRTSEVSFVFFLCVWHYMRHYLNILILFSVWNEFDLIPEHYRTWSIDESHPNGWWLFFGRHTMRIPPWIKYQIFAPIMALQLVNTFWSFLIWRILWRMVAGIPIADVREEGEDTDGEEEAAKKKIRKEESKKKR